MLGAEPIPLDLARPFGLCSLQADRVTQVEWQVPEGERWLLEDFCIFANSEVPSVPDPWNFEVWRRAWPQGSCADPVDRVERALLGNTGSAKLLDLPLAGRATYRHLPPSPLRVLPSRTWLSVEATRPFMLNATIHRKRFP